MAMKGKSAKSNSQANTHAPRMTAEMQCTLLTRPSLNAGDAATKKIEAMEKNDNALYGSGVASIIGIKASPDATPRTVGKSHFCSL